MSTQQNVVAVADGVVKKFRLACKKLSLTFPQCPVPREVMIDFLGSKKDPVIVVVSRETHKDGNFHLHCYLQYDKQFTSTKSTVYDIVYEGVVYHPNIQPTNDKNAWIKYITKTDIDYLSKGLDVSAYLTSRQNKKSYCFYADVVKKGCITKEMIQQNPKMLRGLKTLLNDLEAYKMLPSEDDVKRPALTSVRIWGQDYTVGPRVFKQPQLWICGSKNKGKTTFINELLEKGYKGYEMPTNNDWTGYNDSYDFLYIDEFKGGITIQELNKVLQGNMCRLNTKGGMVIKNKNIPIFIISNYRPSEVYNKVGDDKLDTLLCRLNVIENYDIELPVELPVEPSVGKVLGNNLNCDSNITIAKDCNLCKDEIEDDDSTVSIPSVERCGACRGWCVNGRCACNACDICAYVDCAGCSLIWSDEVHKNVMPRPRRIG